MRAKEGRALSTAEGRLAQAIGTQKKTMEFVAGGGGEDRNGGLLGSRCLGKPESRGQWASAQASLALGKHYRNAKQTLGCVASLPSPKPQLPWTLFCCKAGSVQALK